jgi:hypothetical protein
MILDMIQGSRYLRRSTDRWLLSKNSTTRLEGLDSWHRAGLLWNCSIPITNTKGLYLYPGSNMTPSRPRLQYLLPKINTMVSCPSRIHHQLVSSFVSNPRHHALLNASAFIHGTVLLPNDDVLPTADASTECFEENLLSNGVLLPNSAHMSVSSLYQFSVLTIVLIRNNIRCINYIQEMELHTKKCHKQIDVDFRKNHKQISSNLDYGWRRKRDTKFDCKLKGETKLFFIRTDLAPPLHWRRVFVNHHIICAFEPF